MPHPGSRACGPWLPKPCRTFLQLGKDMSSLPGLFTKIIAKIADLQLLHVAALLVGNKWKRDCEVYLRSAFVHLSPARQRKIQEEFAELLRCLAAHSQETIRFCHWVPRAPNQDLIYLYIYIYLSLSLSLNLFSPNIIHIANARVKAHQLGPFASFSIYPASLCPSLSLYL